MERKRMLFTCLAFVLLIAGIPAVLAEFIPGTHETTKINLMDASNPSAPPNLKGDGQLYVELNDTYEVGETFTVWANVTDVAELNAYQVGVEYDPSVLDVTSWSEGTTSQNFFYLNVDPAAYAGIVNQPMPASGTGGAEFGGDWEHITWALKKPYNASGTGILAVFNFEVVGYGATKIDIILWGAQVATLADPVPTDLDFNTIDILFDNTGLVVSHELSVSVDAPEVLKLGESSLLNATVENIGIENETNVELFLFANGTTLNNATIPNLVSGTSYTLNYSWTATVAATYNITAYVVPVPDENTTENNVATKFALVPPSQWCISHPVVWDAVTYPVGTCSNATVSNLAFNQSNKEIYFDFTKPWYETTGDYWVNVSIPKVLLDGLPTDRWELEVDGAPIVDRIVSSNNTHSFIYFVSEASEFAAKVSIVGNIVIPEFSATLLLLLFMVATLVVVALRKISQTKRKNIGR